MTKKETERFIKWIEFAKYSKSCDGYMYRHDKTSLYFTRRTGKLIINTKINGEWLTIPYSESWFRSVAPYIQKYAITMSFTSQLDTEILKNFKFFKRIYRSKEDITVCF